MCTTFELVVTIMNVRREPFGALMAWSYFPSAIRGRKSRGKDKSASVQGMGLENGRRAEGQNHSAAAVLEGWSGPPGPSQLTK